MQLDLQRAVNQAKQLVRCCREVVAHNASISPSESEWTVAPSQNDIAAMERLIAEVEAK